MTSTQRMMKRLSILGTVVFSVSLVGASWYYLAAPVPSCSDGKQNQGERGTDCGGPCAQACEVAYVPDDLVIRESAFVQGGGDGEYDVLAKVYNPNDELGASVLPYVFRLKDASGAVLVEASGTGFILPQETKTFLSISLKSSTFPQSVEISFPGAKWEKFSGYQEKPALSILNKRYAPVSSGPFFSEVQGTLVNDSVFDFRSVLVKVILRDVSGKPIAFNQTEMNTVRTRESRDFRLRWPKAFPGEVAQVDVEPEADVYHEENFLQQYVENGKFQDLR
jgi:hypothetical protein